jgi:hypothetical protein
VYGLTIICIESASPDTLPSHQVLHAVPAMVEEGSLCDSTVDRQSNSPMRSTLEELPGLHHDMTPSRCGMLDIVKCRPRGKRRGVQRVLKRRLQRGERQLKQLLFGRIVMGWMGERVRRMFLESGRVPARLSEIMKDNPKDESFPSHE